MPRKQSIEEKARPDYLSADGTLNFSKIFTFQPKQTELLRNVVRNGKVYVQTVAGQCLSVGGIRSGKTCGWLMYFIQNYCLQYKNCNLLVLRRTFKELDSGAISDLKAFLPAELYDYDSTKHVATLTNGSKIVFGHCLAAGTLVTTQRGLVPIEEVTTEDLALTRKGFKRILWSGTTGSKAVTQLGPLSLTKEHKVLVNEEWKSPEEITCQKDSEKTVNLLCHRPSYLKALSTIGTQIPAEGPTEFTTRVGEAESKRTSMSLFMKASMELYQKTSKFITRMKTLLTTLLTEATTNCFQLESTEFTTPLLGLGELEGHYSGSRGQSVVGNVTKQLSPEHQRKDFVTLTVEMPSEQTSYSVPVYDLQVEEEHEFFANGILVHNCQNNKDRDIEQYLGQAFPAILVDECGQFSPDAWMMLYSRNIVNAACERDEAGNLPIPAIVGCSNPLGPFYEYYRTLFVQKEPWGKTEEARRDDVDGTWWIPESGEWKKIYDPKNYAYQRSTVMDNAELLKRDPGIITRLNSMPKAKRDKMLLGLDGTVEGQYFDCFDESYHVVNLREDPESIIWQEHQPVWAGQDWGMLHANAIYLFTKALVRWSSSGADYRLKTVCFAEIVTTGGKSYKELASILANRARLPNGKDVKIRYHYFSHEKFARQMERHSPADDYSRELKKYGLPGVTPATRDRIARASLMYNEFKNGTLVILDTCRELILAIPSLMRDPKNIDDVLKVDAKGDDIYDGFSYGLFGQLSAKKQPEEEVNRDRFLELVKVDPIAAHFFKMKKDAEEKSKGYCFNPPEQPVWMGKVQQ
jgi:hypothetical protein